jgi:pimeloyl-ACP methyl ester carboxylesterase
MRRHEARATGALLSDILDVATKVVGDIHSAVGNRVFAAVEPAVGPTATSVRIWHEGISSGLFAIVREIHRTVPRAALAWLAASPPAAAPAVAETPLGDRMLGVLNGMFGDLVADRYGSLALPMAVRAGGRSVRVTLDDIAAAFPDASSHLVLFVHGLCETDDSWRWGARDRADNTSGVTVGERLHAELGCTPVYLRYNSGLPLWRNGDQLAALLEQLVDAWPVPVQHLTLIGHSMGGLVLRSACHQAVHNGAGWPGLVRQVITLGTPHLGAPLEVAAHRAGRALAALPETAPLADALRLRSAGIKDLRFGAILERDWGEVSPDQGHIDTCTNVPLLPTARHYAISATVTRDVHHPMGKLVGDLMVLPGSATGQGPKRSIPFEVHDQFRLGGLHHFNMLSHPAIYQQIRTLIMAPSPETSGS